MADFNSKYTGEEIETLLDDIPTKVSQLTNDSGYITSVAKGTATTQATAQTLMCDVNINGKTVTPVKFNGTVGSSTIPVYMAGGKPTPITSFGEANLSWGGRNIAQGFGPIDAALVDVLRANRFDGLPAGCITVEYSRDGGATWVDYGATDKQKVDLMSQTADLATLYIGKNDTDNPVNVNHKLRVIINTFTQGGTNKLYTDLRKFIIYVGNSVIDFQATCTIKKRAQSDYAAGNDVWAIVSENIPIAGWSGYNVINTTAITTYGNQNHHSREIMFEFSIGNPPASGRGLIVYKIFAYGGVGYVTPSNMAARGHLYSYDYQQNAKFPAKVNAVGGLQENGTNLSSKYLGINAAAKSISDGTTTITPSAIKTMEANLEDIISDVVSIDTSLFPTSTDEVIGFRQTNGGDGVGYSEAWLDRLKGNTVVWNQYDRTSDGTKTQNGITFSWSDGALIINGTATANTTMYGSLNGYKIVASGHKACSIIEVSSGFLGSSSTMVTHSLKNVYLHQGAQNSSIIANSNSNYTYFLLQFKQGDVFDNVKIKSRLYDLTQMFGAGNEPTTIEEFNARKPLGVTDDYNEGELISTTADEIKSVGFNAWDEEWENGIISDDTGTNVSVSTNIRSKNKFKVLPNATYRYEASIAGYFYFYDRNEYYIGRAFVDNKVFTTPANASYARFYVGGAYGTTYNHDICIHLVHTGTRNGQYEPYKEYRLLLPIKDIKDKDGNQLFPNGLLSAGNVYDEITATKAIKRVNRIVLNGSESWSLQSINSYGIANFYMLATEMFGSGIEAISNKLPLQTSMIASTESEGFLLAGTNSLYIRIKSTTASTVAQFKTWLSQNNIVIQTVLAEPIEVDIEEWDRSYEVSDFGTEEVISDTPTAPLKADIIYEYNAKGRIEANERGIEELNDKIAEMNEYSITSDKVWSEDTPVDCTIGEVDNDAFLPEGYGLAGGQSRVARMYVKFTSTATTYEGEFLSSYNDNCLIIGVKGYYELTAPNGTMLKRGYLGDSSVKVEQIGTSGWKFDFAALDMEEGMKVHVGAMLDCIDID